MLRNLVFALLLCACTAHAQTNAATIQAALAVPAVAQIVGRTGGTYDAYTSAQFYALPRHATTRDYFVACGQSNVLSGWTVRLGSNRQTATGRTTTVDFISRSGSTIASWQPGQTNYTDCVNLAKAATGLRGIYIFKGETEVMGTPVVATNPFSQAAFTAAINPVVDGLAGATGVKVMWFKLHDMCNGGPFGAVLDETNVNAAIGDLWANNVNAVAGPDLHDIIPVYTDCVHLTIASETNAVADRASTAATAAGW